MGTLFPNCGEYPDFRPTPAVMIEALQLDIATPMIVGLLIVAVLVAAEDEHDHREVQHAGNQVMQFVAGGTTGSPDVPFVPNMNHEVNDVVIRMHWAKRNPALFYMQSITRPVMSPLLMTEPGSTSVPESVPAAS